MEDQDPLYAARTELAARVVLDGGRRKQEREKALTALKGGPSSRYVDLGILFGATTLFALFSSWAKLPESSLLPAFMIFMLAVQLARVEVRLKAAAKLIVDLVERPSAQAADHQ